MPPPKPRWSVRTTVTPNSPRNFASSSVSSASYGVMTLMRLMFSAVTASASAPDVVTADLAPAAMIASTSSRSCWTPRMKLPEVHR
ncbi:Uncharacterised protein [Mycobacteroides abscessus subsp. abscessus]|nr:Uncharacterised protein [Mycobacteroides abscessus subsp. abscessus]SKU12438.1 Uncharacterised protein [Mycobacteroides abscessus subsp. abscessus]